jgi:hypothetical protein
VFGVGISPRLLGKAARVIMLLLRIKLMKVQVIHDEMTEMTIELLLLSEVVVRLEVELLWSEQRVVVLARQLFDKQLSGHAEITVDGKVLTGINTSLVVFWVNHYQLWKDIKNRFYLS